MKSKEICTVFNRIYDPVFRKFILQPTIIEGVFWQEELGTGRSQNGHHEENEVHIFIPFGAKATRDFGDDKKFRKNPTKFFTLSPEDKIMRGISSGKSLTIVAVQTFDYGSDGLKHWEVVAK